jgi:hypothetical protein
MWSEIILFLGASSGTVPSTVNSNPGSTGTAVAALSTESVMFNDGLAGGFAAEESRSEMDSIRQHPQLTGVRWIDRYQTPDSHFSFGRDQRGGLVLSGWSRLSIRHSSVEDFVRWYLDERFAEIKDQNQLQIWEERRRVLIGAFLEVRAQRREVDFVSGAQYLAGAVVFESARVSDKAFVLRIR